MQELSKCHILVISQEQTNQTMQLITDIQQAGNTQ